MKLVDSWLLWLVSSFFYCIGYPGCYISVFLYEATALRCC